MQEPVIAKTERSLEVAIETLLYACRWLLLPLFLGLPLLVILITAEFYSVLFESALNIQLTDKRELVVVVLTLVDMVLIGSLVVMVAISGYENFVSRITMMDEDNKPTIFSLLDPGTIKVKLGMVIIAISSIQLLQTLMNVPKMAQENDQIWKEISMQIALHTALILGGTFIAIIDRLVTKKHRKIL